MTTASTTAARVEVLTAEVRVLMVGSRQVTMSVYNQLDQVKPGEIEPFGRVAPRDAGSGWVNVVGVSARDADRARWSGRPARVPARCGGGRRGAVAWLRSSSAATARRGSVTRSGPQGVVAASTPGSCAS
jgi:hypothetical protein